MKKILIFILGTLCLFGCISNTKKWKMEDIKYGVVMQEEKRIPLLLQEFDYVYNIKIDSLVITNDIMPYSGYLVTKWDIDEKQDLTVAQWANNGYKDKYIRKEKTGLVEVFEITENIQNKTISWKCNWCKTYSQIRNSK